MKLMHNLAVTVPLLLAASLANAQVVFIDFNDHRSSGIDGENYPDPSLIWNEYATPADVTGGLLDTSGAATGLSISQTGLNDSSSSATNNTGPTWAYISDDAAAVDDFFWTSNTAATTATVTISGLTGLTFELDLMAGAKNHSAYTVQNFSYSLDGGTSWTGFNVYTSDGTLDSVDTLNNSISGYLMQSGRYLAPGTSLSLTSGDSLVIRSTDPSNSASGFNAMRLEVVPEPATYALALGLATLGLVMLRRRLWDR